MKEKTLSSISLYVTRDDIREMHDRYHSDICDAGIANAVSIALRRQLKPKYLPRIVFASNHNACELRIGEDRHPLPQKLYWWLRDSENGIEVHPARFSFSIFSRFLRSRLDNTSRRNGASKAGKKG